MNSGKKLSRNPWSWVPTLYFAEGLPYVAVMTISLILYKQLGLTNAEITFYTSWLYLPWVIKPLWSPFVDIVKTKRWWIITMQLLIGAAFGGVAFTIPTSFWLQGTLFFFWVMAFSSATHDIAADGFYMLGMDQHKQAWFVGIRSTFYRFATIFGQGVLVMIAGNLQVLFRNSIKYSWSLMFYGVTGLFIALWLWHSLVLPCPVSDRGLRNAGAREVWTKLVLSVKTFFTKMPAKQVLIAFLFMLFYRMPKDFGEGFFAVSYRQRKQWRTGTFTSGVWLCAGHGWHNRTYARRYFGRNGCRTRRTEEVAVAHGVRHNAA